MKGFHKKENECAPISPALNDQIISTFSLLSTNRGKVSVTT